jgi:phosphinothricin acetyltransferase
MHVRRATVADAAACAEIYAPFVRDTVVSFEAVPPTADEMAGRIASAQQRHDWLVLVDAGGPGQDDEVVGYAYGGTWRARPAYRFTCELGIYLAPPARGKGGGRMLYEALLERLADLGYRTAVAGMTWPNPASEALHLAVGFAPAGVMRRVGWKHGAWHDVAFFQRPLPGPDPAPPARTPPSG